MISLYANEWHKIAGRGWVAVVKLSDVWSHDLLNKEVKIDEKTYIVTGIETMGRHRDCDPIKGYFYSNDIVGLLIRGDK